MVLSNYSTKPMNSGFFISMKELASAECLASWSLAVASASNAIAASKSSNSY